MLFSMNICLFVCPTAFFPAINEFFVWIAASKDSLDSVKTCQSYDNKVYMYVSILFDCPLEFYAV